MDSSSPVLYRVRGFDGLKFSSVVHGYRVRQTPKSSSAVQPRDEDLTVGWSG